MCPRCAIRRDKNRLPSLAIAHGRGRQAGSPGRMPTPVRGPRRFETSKGADEQSSRKDARD